MLTDEQLADAIRSVIIASGRMDVAIIVCRFDGEQCFAKAIGSSDALAKNMQRWKYTQTSPETVDN